MGKPHGKLACSVIKNRIIYPGIYRNKNYYKCNMRTQFIYTDTFLRNNSLLNGNMA